MAPDRGKEHGVNPGCPEIRGSLRPDVRECPPGRAPLSGPLAAVLAAALSAPAAGFEWNRECLQMVAYIMGRPGPGAPPGGASLPPANRSDLVPGAEVSVANENGNLENVVVVGVSGDRVRVAPPGGGRPGDAKVVNMVINEEGRFRIDPGEGGGARVVARGDVHWPIVPGMRTRKGPIDDGTIDEEFLKWDGTVTMDDLGVRPRPALATTRDLSTPTPDEKLAGLRREAEEIQRVLEDSGEGLEVLRRSDALMARLQEESGRQGIVCFLAKSERGGSQMLVIEGVRPNGNRVAQMYLRAAERLNVRRITVSLVDNHKDGTVGFFSDEGGVTRAEIGFESLLDMLRGGKNATVVHELRHGMIHAWRARGRVGVYHHGLELGVNAKTDFLGGKITEGYAVRHPYARGFNFEEIYTYALDLVRLDSMFRKGGGHRFGKDLEKDILKRVGTLLVIVKISRDVMGTLRTGRPRSWAHDARRGVLSISGRPRPDPEHGASPGDPGQARPGGRLRGGEALLAGPRGRDGDRADLGPSGQGGPPDPQGLADPGRPRSGDALFPGHVRRSPLQVS